jgi:hypothetical protein
MALTDQNSNFISNLTSLGEQLLAQQRTIDLMIAQWAQNGMFEALTDEDIQAIPAFAHLSKSEVANAINAITAVTTALGDLSTGQAVNLLKLKG